MEEAVTYFVDEIYWAKKAVSRASEQKLITNANFKDLEKKGYTIVNDVITKAECDVAIGKYQDWLKKFKGSFPICFNSIIQGYNIGHFETTWNLRLKTKPVFAQLWKTEKLLTSFDAIGIGRPPEEGKEDFQDVRQYWLHTDQAPKRFGLHAYQGTLYLEEQYKDDWTFQVMEGSHKHLDAFYDFQPDSINESNITGYHKMTEEDLQFFKDAGCRLTRVPVKKGGMVLWDSRLIHANARPLPNRKHPGRWRFVAFICMTPAIWATEKDMVDRKEAYERALMTNHWPSQGLSLIEQPVRAEVEFPRDVPENARTEVAMKVSGMIPYDFKDGQPNGDEHIPEWREIRDVKPFNP